MSKLTKKEQELARNLQPLPYELKSAYENFLERDYRKKLIWLNLDNYLPKFAVIGILALLFFPNYFLAILFGLFCIAGIIILIKLLKK